MSPTQQLHDAYGVLEPAGKRWRLRFSRRFTHAPDRVWRAITEPEHLKAWFPQHIVGEWRVGAALRFASEYGDFDGEVLAFEPPRLLEFRWGTDIIRMEVAPDGDGSLFTLIDTFDELGKAARDAAGWHTCLDNLEHELDGVKLSGDGRERWNAVHPVYVDRFGPGAATIGPPDPNEEKAKER
jgi:uncharacterized protein YndB with AHSA1/START domain